MVQTLTSKSENQRSSKYDMMRKIKLAIHERPLKYEEIRKQFSKIKPRTLKNYLAELEGLGDIVNPEKGLYTAPGIRKKVFNNENELKRALAHSNLVIVGAHVSIGGGVWLRRMIMGPDLTANTRAPHDDRFFKYLMDHLKSGYHKTFWISFEKYKKLTLTWGYPLTVGYDVDRCHSSSSDRVIDTGHRLDCIRNGKNWFAYTPYEPKPQFEGVKGSLSSRFDPDLCKPKPKRAAIEIPETVLEEYENYERILTGELCLIRDQVMNRIPLNGVCSMCPDQHFTVKESVNTSDSNHESKQI